MSSKIKLYADDVLLYATIRTEQDCNQLQKDLDSLGKWADDWKLVQKCEFLRIANKKHTIVAQYKIQNKPIEEVNHAKYLGVTISQNLSWSEHIKQITFKANRTKGFLQHNFHNCTPTIKDRFYKAMVKPIIEYAAVVWAPHTKRDIDMIERTQ